MSKSSTDLMSCLLALVMAFWSSAISSFVSTTTEMSSVIDGNFGRALNFLTSESRFAQSVKFISKSPSEYLSRS